MEVWKWGLQGRGDVVPPLPLAVHRIVAMSHGLNMQECVNGIRSTVFLPGEVATPILRTRPVPPSKEEQDRMSQSEDLGAAILFVASMPARTCVNELIIAPTWNRFYVGGLETPKK